MVRMNVSRLIVVGLTSALIMLTALVAVAAQAQGHTEQTISLRMPAMVGLVADNRGNLYTASRHTGYVFCIPPSSKPVLIGKVPGTPTSIIVDRSRNVFVGTQGGAIYQVSLDGTIAEAYRCNSCPMGLEVDRDGGLIIATENGEIVKVARVAFLNAKIKNAGETRRSIHCIV